MIITTKKYQGVNYWIVDWIGKKKVGSNPYMNCPYVPYWIAEDTIQAIQQWIIDNDIECFIDKLDKDPNKIWHIKYRFRNENHVTLFALKWDNIIDNEWDDI